MYGLQGSAATLRCLFNIVNSWLFVVTSILKINKAEHMHQNEVVDMVKACLLFLPHQHIPHCKAGNGGLRHNSLNSPSQILAVCDVAEERAEHNECIS